MLSYLVTTWGNSNIQDCISSFILNIADLMLQKCLHIEYATNRQILLFPNVLQHWRWRYFLFSRNIFEQFGKWLNDMQVCYDTQSYVSLMCVHQSVSRPVVYTGCLWNSGEKNQKGPTCVQEGGVRKSWYVNSEERTACVVCWTDLRGHLIARIDVGIEHMDKPRIPLHFFMFKMYISILNFMLWQQSAHGLVKAQELLGYG